MRRFIKKRLTMKRNDLLYLKCNSIINVLPIFMNVLMLANIYLGIGNGKITTALINPYFNKIQFYQQNTFTKKNL